MPCAWRRNRSTRSLRAVRTRACARAHSRLYPTPNPQVEALSAVCTEAYELLSEEWLAGKVELDVLRGWIEADFYDSRRILVPDSSTPGGAPRFSTSDDVFWCASTHDESELAKACSLHALSPHYPNSLRSFFTEVLRVPPRPEPSTSRLFEAIYAMQSEMPSESTTRVVRECQRRLALRELNDIHHAMQAEGSAPFAHAADECPRHGPGCTHPACRALSSLFGRLGAPSGGGTAVQLPHISMGQLGIGTDARESLSSAAQTVDRALSRGRCFKQPELLSEPVDGLGGGGGGRHASDDCCHPCDSTAFDLVFGWRTSVGPPVYVDRAVCDAQPPYLDGLVATAEMFASLMAFLGNMVRPGLSEHIHLFYEPPLTSSGERRREVFGFNKGGSLWFSLRAFHSLHANAPSVWVPECTSFWFVTLAHELAHNEIETHDVRHATLMERILERFTPHLILSHVDLAMRSTIPARPVGGRLCAHSGWHAPAASDAQPIHQPAAHVGRAAYVQGADTDDAYSHPSRSSMARRKPRGGAGGTHKRGCRGRDVAMVSAVLDAHAGPRQAQRAPAA